MSLVTKRTIRRSRVLLHGIVNTSAGEQKVRIRDVTTAGALLEPIGPSFIPAVEEKFVLVCGDTSVEAQVAWVDSSWFGIKFHVPLTAGSLLDSAGSKLKVSTPRALRYHQLPTVDDEQEISLGIICPTSLH